MVETDKKPVVTAFSIKQASQLLNISERKLTYLIALKQIRSFRIGKSRRVTSAALAEFVAREEKRAAR